MSCLTSTTVAVVLPKNEPAARVWNSGGDKYDRISRQIADAIEHCVDRLNPQPGEKVLDVATGTGWTARQVQARGAVVTGVDLSRTAIDTARRLDTGHNISFQVGDAEALLFGQAEFDAVVSTFGVMFCSAPEKAAGELARVCKPGGRLALAIWDTKGGVYDMFRIISKYKPATATPAPSPFEWSREDRLHELLGCHFDIAVERAVSYYREEKAEDCWDAFATAYGPIKTLAESLEPDKAKSMREEFVEYHRQFTTPLGTLIPRDYLIVKGTRK